MSYPRQLISSLAAQVNTTLSLFFSVENKKYFGDYKDFNEILSCTLQEYIKNEIEKSELKTVYSTQIRMRRQKKTRWLNAFEKNSQCDITKRKNPYYMIQHNFKLLPGNDFFKLYQAADVPAAIELKKKKLDEWKKSTSLLIEYPFLFEKTLKQIVSAYKIDLIIDLINIIINSLDGNIESYFSKKPEILLTSPFFAPSRFSIPLTSDSYLVELLDLEQNDLIFQMMLKFQPNLKEITKIRSFDNKDHQLLLTLINNIKLDFYQSKKITIEIGTLAKALRSRPNEQCYKDVINRLHNMAATIFRAFKKSDPEKPYFTFSFFDSVLTEESENKAFAIVTFGDVLFEAITKKQMVAVTSSSYNSLELDLSKLLYHKLQQERIGLSTTALLDKNGLLYKQYDYSFFQRIILFKKKKKSENIHVVLQALSEFVDKKIAVAHYHYDQNTGLFCLYYYPLNNDEKADLLTKRISNLS